MNLFVYGSLIIPEVFAAVTGIHRQPKPSWIAGYARYCLVDRSYPGLVPEAGAKTHGAVYIDLGSEALNLLDRFEGSLYARTDVLSHSSDGQSYASSVYVIKDSSRHLIDHRDWDLDAFRTNHLSAFLLDAHRGWSAT